MAAAAPRPLRGGRRPPGAEGGDGHQGPGQVRAAGPAVLLNTSTGETESEFHTYVQPQEHPVLSEFCTELTGLTQQPLCFACTKTLLAQSVSLCFLSSSTGRYYYVDEWDFGVCLQYECKRKQPRKPDTLNSWIDLKAACRAHPKNNLISRTLTINFTDKTPLGSNSRPETSRDGTCETNSLDEKNHHGIAGIKINSNVQTEEQQTTCTDSSADVHAVPSSSSRTELHAQAQSSLAASTDKFLVPLEQAQQSHSTVSTGIRQGLSNGQPLSTARYSPPVHGSGLVLVSTTISSVNISNEDISTSSDCLSLLTDGEGVALIPESQYEQNSECDKFKDDSSTDILTVFEEKTISKQLAVMRSDNQSLEETVVPVEPLKSIIYKSPDTTIYNVGTVQRQTSNFSAFKLPSAMVNAISALSALAGNCSAPSEVPKRKPASPKTFPPAKKQSFAICQEKTTSFDHSLSLRSSNLSKASPAILNFTVNLNQSVRAVKNGKPTPPLSNCGRRAKKLYVSKAGPNHGKAFFCCPVGKHEGNKKGCGYFKWEYALLKEKSNGLTLNADALTSLGTYASNLRNSSNKKYLCLRPCMRT
ncbi:LOW QUALITY PROTEIN: ERI1 exoribonuclease 2 [Mycteria americana]|uniref:LOW QUALITY PROTEIN: ERI1 exoribonuclease 2 n=1 Tax=Mycteria americana TaxID=33587 RepID=UPI003F583F5A